VTCGSIPPSESPREEQTAVRLWVVNVGFDNILIGLGALIGVLLINLGDAAAGRALVFFVCGMHVILGPILAVTEPKLWRNAVGEFVLPLLVIVVALVWS
jgi:putative membrane protein